MSSAQRRAIQNPEAGLMVYNTDRQTFFISAITDDVNGASQRGSAYIYTLQGGGWIQTSKLIASDDSSGDNFDRSVSINGDYELISSYQADATYSNQGACYIIYISKSDQ